MIRLPISADSARRGFGRSTLTLTISVACSALTWTAACTPQFGLGLGESHACAEGCESDGGDDSIASMLGSSEAADGDDHESGESDKVDADSDADLGGESALPSATTGIDTSTTADDASSTTTSDDTGQDASTAETDSNDSSDTTSSQSATDTSDDTTSEATTTDAETDATDADADADADDGSDDLDSSDDILDVSWTALDATDFWGTSGTLHGKDQCPDDEILIGLRGYHGDRRIRGLQGQCGRVRHDPRQMDLRVEASSQTPFRGHERGDPFELVCPEDQVARGFALDVDYNGLYRISVKCGRLKVVDDDELELIKTGDTQSVGTAKGSSQLENCGTTGVAWGPRLSTSSSRVTAFGLHCRRPRLDSHDDG